jgi:hypothetical protein
LNAYTYRSAIITEIRTLLIRLSEYEAAFTARVVVGESSGVYVLRVLLQCFSPATSRCIPTTRHPLVY